MVEFTNAGDRRGHAVLAAEGSERMCLLASVEGSGDESWPASPPLQELHIEPRGDGQCVALLVGRAGGGHWSMSIEADPAAERLTFDIACRLKGIAQWLGSTYRVMAPVHVLGDGLSIGSGAMLRLLDDAALRHAPIEVAGDVVRIGPGEPSHSADVRPRTFRWRYAIQAAPPDTMRSL